MIQLNNLRDWKSLGEGEVLELHKKKSRSVKLHLSAPDPTRLYYQYPGDSPRFLARVCGIDVVSFVCEGEIDVIADGPVLFRTADNERAVAQPDGEKFTKMMERAPRNPEMEAVQRAMYANMERRLAQQSAEFNRVLNVRARVDAQRIERLERELDEFDEPTSDEGHAHEEPEKGSDAGEQSPPGDDDSGSGAPKRATRRRKKRSADAEEPE